MSVFSRLRRGQRFLRKLKISRKRLFGVGRRNGSDVSIRQLKRRIASSSALSSRFSQKLRKTAVRRSARLDRVDRLILRSRLGRHFAGAFAAGGALATGDFIRSRRTKDKALKKAFRNRAVGNLLPQVILAGAPGVVANRVISFQPRTSVAIRKRVRRFVRKHLKIRRRSR